MDSNDAGFYGIACFFALLLLVAGAAIGDAAYHHFKDSHEKEQVIEGWEPPVIPSCNKELWDRIREGCD